MRRKKQLIDRTATGRVYGETVEDYILPAKLPKGKRLVTVEKHGIQVLKKRTKKK